jgi:CheY-like chemotaxis protein
VIAAGTPPKPFSAVGDAGDGSLPLPRTSRHVLVIEDEEDFRDTLQFVLGREGLEVTSVGTGAAAVAAARGRRFDLVITDLRMPGMSGTDTIAALKDIDPDVPVIVATGYATDEISEVCRARGVGHFLRKPFDLHDFITLVLRVLG